MAEPRQRRRTRPLPLHLQRGEDETPLPLRSLRVDVVEGPSKGLSALVSTQHPLRIGNAPDCELALEDSAVDPYHASLTFERGVVRLTDHGSQDGTYLDGLRVFDAVARFESTIRIGDSVLRVRATEARSIAPSIRQQCGQLRGISRPMRQLFTQIERAAASNATVLVEGETGTGKELAARALHDLSDRRDGPFVVLDCSSVPSALFESVLFGHVRGAFTDAVRDVSGVFDAASGGTLFLDEVGELPSDLQPKLLRVLESRRYTPVGSNEAREINVRLVAATNRSLASEVDEGHFRQDLYYRLAVVKLDIPPLRERPEDIAVLIDHFIQKLDSTLRPPPELAQAMLQEFVNCAWPGNARQLRNSVERTAAVGYITHLDVRTAMNHPCEPTSVAAEEVDLSLPLPVARERLISSFERAYLVRLLDSTRGNVTRAAAMAGIDRRTLQRVMRRYQIGQERTALAC